MRKDIQVLFDEATEKSLIGAFLINPENLMMSTLKPEQFSNRKLGELYGLLREMAESHTEIDISTVYSEVSRREKDSWTKPDLYALTTDCSSSMHWQSYEEIIRDLASRRSVIAASSNLYNDALNTEKPLAESISKVIDGISQSAGVPEYRDWETDRKSTRLNSSHSGESRMPSSA